MTQWVSKVLKYWAYEGKEVQKRLKKDKKPAEICQYLESNPSSYVN